MISALPDSLLSTRGALDALAYLVLLGGMFSAVSARVADASAQLERLLAAAVLNAAALALWNDLHDPAVALSRWLSAALPSLLLAAVISAASHAHFASRRYISPAGALLGLFWIYGVMR